MKRFLKKLFACFGNSADKNYIYGRSRENQGIIKPLPINALIEPKPTSESIMRCALKSIDILSIFIQKDLSKAVSNILLNSENSNKNPTKEEFEKRSKYFDKLNSLNDQLKKLDNLFFSNMRLNIISLFQKELNPEFCKSQADIVIAEAASLLPKELQSLENLINAFHSWLCFIESKFDEFIQTRKSPNESLKNNLKAPTKPPADVSNATNTEGRSENVSSSSFDGKKKDCFFNLHYFTSILCELFRIDTRKFSINGNIFFGASFSHNYNLDDSIILDLNFNSFVQSIDQNAETFDFWENKLRREFKPIVIFLKINL